MFQNKLKNLLFFFALTVAAQQSHAIFVISPSVGYKMQSAKFTDNADVESELKASNPAFGLKLGVMSASGVSFDIAGSYVSGKAMITNAGVEVEHDLTEQSAAAQLGISTNTFKIYLGYLLMNEAKIKQTTTEVTLKGSGYQVGLALHLTGSISLGVQYQIDQYNKVKIDAISSEFEEVSTYYKKIDSQSKHKKKGILWIPFFIKL
jgi:Outer membrane protein beta-barrel domain